MGRLIDDIWFGIRAAPGETWQWFNGLGREEWLVVLAVVCACGFLCLLGFRRTI
jgi:hypothetical protein